MEREHRDTNARQSNSEVHDSELEQQGTQVNPDTLGTTSPRASEPEPDFTQAPADTDSIDVTEVTEDVYFPPTDPVVSGKVSNNREVMEGTFEPDSTSSMEVDPSVSGGTGDEGLADAIRRELRQDAATTDLQVEVRVEEGVAYLRGRVIDLDDVDNAEEVAGRVPGVRDVVEELEIGG